MKNSCHIFFFTAGIILFTTNHLIAQTDSSYLTTEEILEDILQEPVGEVDESDLYEQLELLMLNPINLNTASVDELLKIPIMEISAAQLIVEHRNKYGYFFR
ncbi:MAG: helix-hairpin-helix domain-containing protein [Ignavibacteriaceae bacterium]|nr:helix-hairpin-helix domain-containing protein [Ignavibacteriaceae bacterium]